MHTYQCSRAGNDGPLCSSDDVTGQRDLEPVHHPLMHSEIEARLLVARQHATLGRSLHLPAIEREREREGGEKEREKEKR